MKKALLFGIMVVTLGIMLTFFQTNVGIHRINYSPATEYNCENPDVVYLTADEKHMTGLVASNIKGIAVVPEENMLVADTALLMNCDGIDFSYYLEGAY